MPLNVQNREIVIPGELLADGKYLAGANTIKEGDAIYATKVGLANIEGNRITVVALAGCYIPAVGDQVIGRIVDIGLSGWQVDIDAPYPAMLPASEAADHRQEHLKQDLTRILDVGDLIIGKVLAFDRTRDPLLTIKGQGLGRITSGRVIKISPAKVPRLIGRKGSMINMIKRETGCQVIVGKNGRVLVSSRYPLREQVAVAAIYKIEREAHIEGLTDRVREMIRRMVRDASIHPG
ncbi:MAG: exosome complex RNA-binding protein Rrp4 [Candidatus Bathyarchaeia archaeon]|nr:RNA-binding protein [Candidatus Bathyarchaeota archaeon]